MRLLILSDLHREVWYRPQIQHESWLDPCPKIDLAISQPDWVGDIDVGAQAMEWADKTFAGLPVLYVPGNHEGYGQNLDEVQKDVAEACAATGHVHYLDRRELVIGGVRGRHAWTVSVHFAEIGPRPQSDFVDLLNQLGHRSHIGVWSGDERKDLHWIEG